MPKRSNSSSNVHRRLRLRPRLIPPTTYHGSGTEENPIVINDLGHTAEVVDGGLEPMQPPMIASTEPSQADLDEHCIVLTDYHTEYQIPWIIRKIVNCQWLSDADPVPQECIPSLVVALAAVKRVKEAMDIARARQQTGVNFVGGVQLRVIPSDLTEGNSLGGVKLRRIPSDLTSITIASQDSARSGATEEYKFEELEDIMVQEVTKPAELEDVTDDDVV